MARKRHGAEQVVGKLREEEVELAGGATAKEACRKLEITEHTLELPQLGGSDYRRSESIHVSQGWKTLGAQS